MFLILSLVLTMISIALKLIYHSLSLAYKMGSRVASEDMKTLSNITIKPTIKALRVVSFVISRIRDVITIAGILVFIMQMLFFLFVVVISYSVLDLFV